MLILLTILGEATLTKQIKMTEFDEKLNLALHAHKMKTKEKTYKIAQNAGIAETSLYNFTAGTSSLNAENTHKLMQYLNLTVNLEKK